MDRRMGSSKWKTYMAEQRCRTSMTLNLISTDRSRGPLSRAGRGAVLVNYGLNDSNNACI